MLFLLLAPLFINLLSDTSSAPPVDITMVDPSSFDDIFEQPTLGNQSTATQDLNSGSSDTSDYGSTSESSSDSDSDLDYSGNSDSSRHSEPKEGVIKAYLTTLKASLSDQIGPRSKQLPDCYKQGQFWIHPRHPFFAMDKAAVSANGITPESLIFLMYLFGFLLF